uniref:Putative ovule protein n=1 Tax=Solanum chacoense TaxID=4108 RepID=A0A0V0GLW0_SOLCH
MDDIICVVDPKVATHMFDLLDELSTHLNSHPSKLTILINRVLSHLYNYKSRNISSTKLYTFPAPVHFSLIVFISILLTSYLDGWMTYVQF